MDHRSPFEYPRHTNLIGCMPGTEGQGLTLRPFPYPPIYDATMTVTRPAPPEITALERISTGYSRPTGTFICVITKSTENTPENVYETVCTISATADPPLSAKEDLHLNITITSLFPDSRSGYCYRFNQIQPPPLHMQPPNR